MNFFALAAVRIVAAMSDAQYSLAPAGEQGGSIAKLWWLYFWVLTAIFILVALFVFFAVFPRREQLRSADGRIEVEEPKPSGE
ncbi:MAG: hypothetical protein ACJ8JD_09590, partial [Chthoniobacterales bacterium]